MQSYEIQTCGRANFSAPYNQDLLEDFRKQEAQLDVKAALAPCVTACLGSPLALSGCVHCLKNQNDSLTEHAWGCRKCETTVARIALYVDAELKTSPTLKQITDYLENIENYQTTVNANWDLQSECEQGRAIRKFCLEKPTFTLQVTPDVDPPAPNEEHTSQTAVIVLGVFGGLLGFAVLAYVVWRYRKRDREVVKRNDGGPTATQIYSDGPLNGNGNGNGND